MNPTKSWHPVWENIFASQPWGKYPPEHVIRFIARNFYKIAPRSSVRILDLGSGPGACTWYVAREGFSACAIEGSPTAIEQCRARLISENLKADMVVGDYTQLPWEDNSFDAVIDNATFCCNTPDNVAVAISEVLRVLRPGGKLISCNFTPNTWGYGTGQGIARNTFDDLTEGPLAHKGTQFFMDEDDIQHLYSEFKSLEIETISYSAENRTKQVESWVITATK